MLISTPGVMTEASYSETQREKKAKDSGEGSKFKYIPNSECIRWEQRLVCRLLIETSLLRRWVCGAVDINGARVGGATWEWPGGCRARQPGWLGVAISITTQLKIKKDNDHP